MKKMPAILFSLLVTGFTRPGFAQEKPVPAIDPEAIAALEKMGAYLRTLKTFEVNAFTMTDEVIDGNMKVQFSGNANMKVRRPDRLRAEISTDRKQRQIFYDGKSVTLYGPRVKYYATVAAPPTLGETAEVLAQKYGIDLPLADLFYWGTEKAPLQDIKSAIQVGPATVDGIPTDHYLFRQEGLDWQIWIQKGKTPLPRKMVLTTTSEPVQPEHIAILRWTVAPKLDESMFTFKPPKDAMRIALQNADGKVEAAAK